MPPQSRGSPIPIGLQSKSTPTLPTTRSFNISLHDDPLPPIPREVHGPHGQSRESLSPITNTSSGPSDPSELASVEDNALTESFTSELNAEDGSDASTDEEDDTLPVATRAQTLPSSRSYTHLRPTSTSSSGLFPPFYNRPPTPLPPSPSLTSLLRPSFSTQTSRPTTPDSSDIEVQSSHIGTTAGTSTPPSSTAAGLTKSARTATTVPRASPKVPTYEYYGFALYLASSATFLLYLLWAFLPSPFLHQLGIYYYPDRWWALAVPAWLVMAVGWIYVALASYNVEYLTWSVSSIENVVDEAAQIAVVDGGGTIVRRREPGKGGVKTSILTEDVIGPHDERIAKGRDWKSLWSEGTDAVMDVPIGGVCEILYGDEREEEER